MKNYYTIYIYIYIAIIKLNTHITGLNKDIDFYRIMTLSCLHLFTEH